MMTTLTTLKIFATLAAALFLSTDPPNITGTWNMGVEADHVVPIALVLKQEETHVTGTILMPTDRNGGRVDVPLAGEFVNGAFSLSGTVERAKEATKIELEGRLKDDGSLEGTITTPHGKLPWTAERLKARK